MEAGLGMQTIVEATSRLERSARLLLARAGQLEELVCHGEEEAWIPYLLTLGTLAHVLDHLTPGRRGELLTTSQMAARLQLRSEEHTSELQSLAYLVCRLLLEKKKYKDRRTP